VRSREVDESRRTVRRVTKRETQLGWNKKKETEGETQKEGETEGERKRGK
jgi:hypothetical protein